MYMYTVYIYIHTYMYMIVHDCTCMICLNTYKLIQIHIESYRYNTCIKAYLQYIVSVEVYCVHNPSLVLLSHLAW